MRLARSSKAVGHTAIHLVARKLWDWQVFQPLAASYGARTVRLSGDSLALFLSTEELTEFDRWQSGAGTPDTTEQDAIEALVALAYEELMANPLIGTIQPYATAFPPDGMLQCDGATHLRADHPALYAVLDAPFIVDADHFVTPNLQGRVTIGVGTTPGTGTVYSAGGIGGAENHALTTAELASHNHVVNDPTHGHVLTDAGHIHAITDPQHGHSLNNPTHTHGVTDGGHIHTVTDPQHHHIQATRGTAAGAYTAGATSGNFLNTAVTGDSPTGISVDNHVTGIGINAAAANQSANNASTGISVNSHTTGISEALAATGVTLQNTGSGDAHENRPLYMALKVGIWAT